MFIVWFTCCHNKTNLDFIIFHFLIDIDNVYSDPYTSCLVNILFYLTSWVVSVYWQIYSRSAGLEYNRSVGNIRVGKIWIIKCKFLFRYPITSFCLFIYFIYLFIASCIKNKTLMMFVDFYFGNCLVCSGPHRFLRRLRRER